jgi:hypothetical protein
MKKLLLASVVLMGMGASQAFAADSDTFTADVEAIVGNVCEIRTTAPTITSTVGTVTTGTAANASIDADISGVFANGFDEAVDITVKLVGQSFCNYTHSVSIISQHKGGLASNLAAPAASGSDKFVTVIPYALSLLDWASTATTGVAWTQPAEADIRTFQVNAPADEAAWKTDVTANTAKQAAVANNSPFHNDGATTGGLNSTGLGFKLTHTISDNSNPMLAGKYTDRLYLKIGQAI